MGKNFIERLGTAATRFRMGLRSRSASPHRRAAALIAFVWLAVAITAPAVPFLAGADFSDLSFFESRGKVYRSNGQAQDGLAILHNAGINCVRLRLWTGSDALVRANNAYNYTNNLSYTLPLAVRVKQAGLLLCLDFHYSDTWADPSHQATPSAWLSLDFAGMVQQMRSYSSNTLAAFAAAGAMPDYVQIGNEITQGILFTNAAGMAIGRVTGSYNTSWSQLGQLMNAAIQGIRDVTNATGARMPGIIVHIDRGGDWPTTQWFFENLNAQSVPYDYIGESYYPFFQGSPTNLQICLSNAAVEFGKPVVVAETAFPFTNTCPTAWQSQLFGFPPTSSGQVSFIAALAEILKGVPNRLGAGVFYWGAEYQTANGVNEAGFNTASFFDATGNVLPVAAAVGGMAAPLWVEASVDGTNLDLQWPFSGAAMDLMTSTALAPATAWTSVPSSIQVAGTVFSITLPVDSSQSRFYRLQSH